MKKSPFPLLALAPLLAAAPAVAQTDGDGEQTIHSLDVIGQARSGYLGDAAQGASKLALPVKELPQSVTVATREYMDDFALFDVGNVLESTANVNVEQVETDRIYFTSRGFDINNFQIDGLGLPLINNNMHGRIDTAIYEQVEVIAGANGLMTGIGSPAATINLVRKRPTAEPMVNLRGTVGSWDQGRLEADASGPLADGLRGRVVVARDDADSYLDRYAQDSTVVYGVLDYDLSRDTVVSVGHSEHRNEATGNMWGALTLYYGDGTPTDFDESTNIAADWSEWTVRESRSFVDLSHALSEDWRLRLAWNRVRTDEDSLLFYTYLADPEVGLDPETGLGLVGYGSEYDLDDKQDMVDLYVNGSFDFLGRRHEAVVGANWSRLDYVESSLYDYHTGNGFPPMPPLEQWDGDTPLPEFTDDLTGSDVENRQKAVYAQARWSLTDEVKLLTGARYNDFQTRGTSYDEDETRDEAEVIPYLGLTWDITDTVLAYASYTETFMAQSERDRQRNLLPPLTGTSSELGLKAELFDGRALASVAWFDMEQENLAVSDGEIRDPETGVVEQVHRAADGITSAGLEVSLSGQLAEGLQATLTATHFDIDGNDMVSNYTPENMLRLSATYRVPALPGLSVGANLQWQEEISRVQGTVADIYPNAGETIVTRQDDYALVNLMASYAFTDRLSLNVNVNNLTDEKYYTSLYWDQGYYGAPRNYSASLRWSF